MKKGLVLVLAFLLSAVMLAACAAPTQTPTPTPTQTPKPTATTTATTTTTPTQTTSAPIQLNFVTFIPTSNPEYAVLFKPFFTMVDKHTNGRIKIIERGGPEVIAANDLLNAVTKGTIDMTNCPTSFYGSAIPGSDTTRLSEVVERDVPGCFEYIQSLYAKDGLYYLGRTHTQGASFLFTFFKNPVTKLADLKGRRIAGASEVYNTFYESLGLTPLNVPLTEYYTATERGVADGNASSIQIWFGTGLWEITKNFIDHGWSRQPGSHLINMNAWNKIPADVQKGLLAAQIEFENYWFGANEKMKADIQKNTEAKGAKFIKLPADEAVVYTNNFFKTGWEYDYKRYPKDIVAKLESMIRKTK